MESSHLGIFLQSWRWKWKENSARDFLSHQKEISPMNVYQKGISPMNVFIILQLSANYFQVRTKGRKQQHYKKLMQTRYFNILCTDAKLAVLLRFRTLTKVELRSIPLLHFPKCFQIAKWFMDNLLCLRDVWKYRSYLNAIVSVSSIFSNGQFCLK